MMDFNKEAMFHIGLTPSQGAAFALLTGPVMQWVFQLFSFDVRSLHAETLLETVGIWTGRRAVERGQKEQPCGESQPDCGQLDQRQDMLSEVD